jgi:hypothetical protein
MENEKRQTGINARFAFILAGIMIRSGLDVFDFVMMVPLVLFGIFQAYKYHKS